MKSTGVVRKIDELGRLVIPKEIRKSLNIRSGEDIEIFIEEDKIVLKKYQKMLSAKENAQKYIDALTKITSDKVLITDKEIVIASTHSKETNEKIDNKTIELMNERKSETGKRIKIGSRIYDENYHIMPIIVDADAVGSIIILKDKEINEEDKTIVKLLNAFIQEQIY